MLRVFVWAEHSTARPGTEGGHVCCTHTYTHTHRHIHTYTSEGLCEAIPKSCSSFLSSSSVVGIPGLFCRPRMSNLPRTTRCHHLDLVPVVPQKPLRSRVNLQPRARCSEPGKHTRQVHGQYSHDPWQASTRATHGDHVAQLEGQVAPKPPFRTSFPTALSSTLLSAMPELAREQGPPSHSPGIPPRCSGDEQRAGCCRQQGNEAGAYSNLIFYTALFISCWPVSGGSSSERAHAGNGEDDGF